MNLVVVNYHYIDDEKKYNSGIYPISTDRLRNQLIELGSLFNFISEADLLLAIKGEKKIRNNSCLITFDDGLRTQYENAVPILKEMQIPAIFFINSLPYISNRACTVHKIWSILSIAPAWEVLDKVLNYYKQLTGAEIDLDRMDNRRAKKENKYENDNKTRQLKFLLNSLMKPNLSSRIISMVFDDYFNSEIEFCQATYMSQDQVIEVSKHEFFSIGLHTNSHVNIPHATKKEVEDDILYNYNFLRNNLGLKNIKGISYPIGAIEESDILSKVESIVKPLGIEYGFAINREVNYGLKKPLLLKRFDTNDVNGGKSPIIDLGKI